MSKEKKYRFYYSKKQDSVDEEMWGFTPRFTFVKTPNGYKQYSELCSIKGTRCNWADAELVYETDDNPEIITHEAIPELIAELEHRLSNCIEPKFEYGQQVFYIANGYILSKWFYECESKDGIIISRYLHSQGEMVYRRKPKDLVFATEEEAKAKLEEMKNG